MNENDYLIPWDKDKLEIFQTEVLILGSGIAGLFAAIKLCPKYEITVLTKKDVMASNTEHAQGGIAVALNEDDSPEFHYGDTIKAGAGLCNLKAVKILAEKGPECVSKLIDFGTKFDESNNKLDFTREGAHSKSRVLHAHGDATGGEIERALVEVVHSSPITVKENYYLIDFVKNSKAEVCGALVLNNITLAMEIWLAKAVILATGGAGQMYKHTTNPAVATGDGIAAAYRAGAELMDMEFIQFHPTALLLPGAPNFLISEAARGEGAVLVNSRGERFMEGVPGKELAPRDVVSREIWKQMQTGQVYLDFSPMGHSKVEQRFPGIHKTCLNYGVDISTDPVPVGPAAHYLMGGVRINEFGETNLPNLFACGECACNGVHGANRLASNSLLDGLVFASTISDTINQKIGEMPNPEDVLPYEGCPDECDVRDSAADPANLKEELQNILWDKVGIIRDEEHLRQAQAELNQLMERFNPHSEVSELELGNMLAIGMVIIKAALAREESRGGHFRRDFPNAEEHWQKHSVYMRGDYHVRYVSI
ncbi:L-aspartate oxidase [Dehalobacter sp. TBBPA1]|uniref:L-aspartate oxidase n=1 Tax=Dehalobacter sp. TBBPA1 TaxID=3235037 RepID=UPI0034A0E4CA